MGGILPIRVPLHVDAKLLRAYPKNQTWAKLGGMTKAKEPKPPRPKRAGPTTPANPTTGSFQVSDELWAVLAPLIPQRVNTHPLGGGRPRVPDRTCANGISYVLRTGCQWKALDATGICSGSTAHLRFQEWVAAGVFRELYQGLTVSRKHDSADASVTPTIPRTGLGSPRSRKYRAIRGHRPMDGVDSGGTGPQLIRPSKSRRPYHQIAQFISPSKPKPRPSQP